MSGNVGKDSQEGQCRGHRIAKITLKKDQGTRTPLALLFCLTNDDTKRAGKQRYPAAGIEQNVVHLLPGAVPSVDGFSHRARKVPADP